MKRNHILWNIPIIVQNRAILVVRKMTSKNRKWPVNTNFDVSLLKYLFFRNKTFTTLILHNILTKFEGFRIFSFYTSYLTITDNNNNQLVWLWCAHLNTLENIYYLFCEAFLGRIFVFKYVPKRLKKVLFKCRSAAQKCVLKFLPSRVALGHASSLLSLLLCHNNKLSRLDACQSATREGKNFNTHFWAAYAPT
jgi:hypothetical protein